jgi:hypothetical protein
MPLTNRPQGKIGAYCMMGTVCYRVKRVGELCRDIAVLPFAKQVKNLFSYNYWRLRSGPDLKASIGRKYLSMAGSNDREVRARNYMPVGVANSQPLASFAKTAKGKESR